ncbi:MAG: acyltransferase [Clostridia bacterium]|nr:acyltransferase [Clostridia bacterium]
MREKEFEFLNIAKGIGILLVVVGHAITKEIAATGLVWSIVRNSIYEIHMPLFFIVAGFLFDLHFHKYQENGFKVFLVKKSRKYMIPYIMMNIFAISVFLIIGFIPAIKSMIVVPSSMSNGLFGILKAVVLFIHPIDEHLWFAYIMFIVLILNYLIYGRRKSNSYKNLILVLSFVLYILSYSFTMPYLIKKTFRYNLFFAIGCYLKRKGYDGELSNIAEISLFAGFFLSLASYLYFFSGNNLLMPIQGIVVLIIGVAGTLIVFSLSKKILKFKILKKPFLFLNSCSYPIYLYHQPFIVSGTVVVLTKLKFIPLIAVPIAVIVGLALPIAVYKMIISKNKVLNTLFVGG